ncbi:MAG: GGDEF domain-containing phosphodiesterase, partial [Pseudomonadota bacterium]|nr:GGDEF domain-containing phosphodiesterase [Pseudomonadota bacterium]
GDVYGIVLPRCPEGHLGAVAEKILDSFRNRPIELPSGDFHISVSIGGVAFPGAARTAHDVMTRAERAMQQVKQRGRDSFIQYQRSENQMREHRKHLQVGEKVLEAIDTKKAVFAYQPVLENGGTKVAFHEALLRIQDSDGSLLPAGRFIPAVERLGLTRVVDLYVLEMAMEELARFSDARLAINISGLTVSDRSWLRRLIALLKENPGQAERVIVEITETAAMQDIEESARFVRAVRDQGCKVALDDFGSGYTSFHHLKALTVDIVKIDGSFVQGLADNRNNQLFIRTLLDLVNAFGLRAVAECVETRAEAEFLNDLGVHYLQGYYYGRPKIGEPWIPCSNETASSGEIVRELAG